MEDYNAYLDASAARDPARNAAGLSNSGADRRAGPQHVQRQPMGQKEMSEVPLPSTHRPSTTGNSMVETRPSLDQPASTSSQADTRQLQVGHLPPALQAGGARHQSLNPEGGGGVTHIPPLRNPYDAA